MAESVTVTNMPDSGSKHRVALELMDRISNAEYYERGSKGPEKARDYYLELYKLCRQTVY